jgi:hypothetical protein
LLTGGSEGVFDGQRLKIREQSLLESPVLAALTKSFITDFALSLKAFDRSKWLSTLQK